MNGKRIAMLIRRNAMMFDQKEVAQFDRPLPAEKFKEEFLRWIE